MISPLLHIRIHMPHLHLASTRHPLNLSVMHPYHQSSMLWWSTRSHKILSWSLSIVQTCTHLSRFVYIVYMMLSAFAIKTQDYAKHASTDPNLVEYKSLCHHPYSFNWLVYRSVRLMALCQSRTSQRGCIYSVLCMLTLQRGISSSGTRVPWTSKGSSMI